MTVSVAVWPAASAPDIGATATFFSRPGGSETDQLTGPPAAVSVIVPVPGGVTSSVAGLTVSVPAAVALPAPAPAPARMRAGRCGPRRRPGPGPGRAQDRPPGCGT